MSLKTKTTKTQVYKAALDLRGETVDEFTLALRAAAAEMLFSGAQSVWLTEVRAGSAVFEVWGSDLETKYFQHMYSRSLEGEFEFSEGSEVERFWYWMPKMD